MDQKSHHINSHFNSQNVTIVIIIFPYDKENPEDEIVTGEFVVVEEEASVGDNDEILRGSTLSVGIVDVDSEG